MAEAALRRHGSAPFRPPVPPKRMKPFLAKLANSSKVSAAARAGKVDTSTVYERRRKDAEFARKWQVALCEGCGSWVDDCGITARDDQHPPPGDWRVWLVMAGRGLGKTRTWAEWVRAIAEARPEARIAIVAASLVEARAVVTQAKAG